MHCTTIGSVLVSTMISKTMGFLHFAAAFLLLDHAYGFALIAGQPVSSCKPILRPSCSLRPLSHASLVLVANRGLFSERPNSSDAPNEAKLVDRWADHDVGLFSDDTSRIGSRTVLDAMVDNMNQGTVGKRGEIWTVLQLGVLASFAVGTFPVFGNGLIFWASSFLLTCGCALIAASFHALGPTNLTPFPEPTKQNLLTTDGMFGAVRHPMCECAVCPDVRLMNHPHHLLPLTTARWRARPRCIRRGWPHGFSGSGGARPRSVRAPSGESKQRGKGT